MVESKFMNEMNAKSLRKGLINAMKHRFGGSASHEDKISQIEDVKRLDRMLEKLFDVTSWDALLKIQ